MSEPDWARLTKLGLSELLLRFSDKTLAFDTRFAYKIEQGEAFSASHRFESVAADGYVYFYGHNPTNSNVTVYVIAIEVTSTGKAFVDLFRNPTVSAAGTDVTITNLNFGSSNVSKCTVQHGGSYTVGASAHQTVIPGGSKNFAIGGLAEVGERVIVPVNNSLLVRAQNKSTAAEHMSIRFIWWEES